MMRRRQCIIGIIFSLFRVATFFEKKNHQVTFLSTTESFRKVKKMNRKNFKDRNKRAKSEKKTFSTFFKAKMQNSKNNY